jgi:long-chain acyl-CoA synthetase
MAGGLWSTFDEVAKIRGNAPAIIQGDRHVTFSQLRLDAASYAASMIQAGVQAGDRCLLVAPNSPELAAAILASWMVGGILTLINDEAPKSHLAHAAAVTQPKIAIARPDRLDVLASFPGCRVLSLEERSASPLQEPVRAGHAFEPASIFFTSGSTGMPKGVTQNHSSLRNGCHMVSAHLGLRADDKIICPIPWAFDYGYGQLLSTVLLGITQILPDARSSIAICDAIAAHRPTVFAGVPSIFALLLRGLSSLRQTDLTSLRLITSTGGAVPDTIYNELLDVFAHCDVSLNYGMTETYRSAGLPCHLARTFPKSVGFAYNGVSLSILREAGGEAKPDEIGQIVHRGTGTFMGYWGAPKATAEVLRPDPFWQHPTLAPPLVVYTGDLGSKSGNGLLTIKGRKDRIIKSMGVRVSPDEVETLIRNTGFVRDVAVFSVPHEIMGEMIIAAVIPGNEIKDVLQKLKSYSQREMSSYMQPRIFKSMDEFPLTPNGKTNLPKLRADYLSSTGAPNTAKLPARVITT